MERPLHTLNLLQDRKLMFGLLFSLKSLNAKVFAFLFFSFVVQLFSCCFVSGVAEF
jgi:hypothetical protein